MAAKKLGKKLAFNTQFVRVSLSSDDKKAIPEWRKKHQDELDNYMTTVMGDGHKISFSFSEHNDSYIVSITGKPEDCVNSNKCYTSHGKDYATALWVALYKYFVMFRGEAWEDLDDDEDFG